MEAIRICLMLTGIAVWVLVLSVTCGIAGSKIRLWDGWERIADWWHRANDDR